MKKFVCVVLAALMGAGAWAETETVNGVTWSYTVSGGEATVTGATPCVGEIVMPARLGGYPVTTVGHDAFAGCGEITKMTLPAGLKRIDAYAFDCCIALTEVNIPDGVSDLGYEAFNGCALRTVELPDSLISFSSDGYQFSHCRSLESVKLPKNLTSIPTGFFYECSKLKAIVVPARVTSLGGAAFYGCASLESVLFFGGAPQGVAESDLPKSNVLVFARDKAASWHAAGFTPKNYLARHDPVVKVLSSQIRESDPTIMDVEYLVESPSPTVKVRALAFKDGARSFANVVRPETFVDGTAANIGDAIEPNKVHKLSWNVAADYGRELTKFKFEVLAQDGDLLPMDWITIPASEQYPKMKVSYNTFSARQYYDALLWLYAANDAGLNLSNGQLWGGGKCLADGSSLFSTYNRTLELEYRYTYFAHEYLFAKMGLNVLSGDTLTYANEETRKDLRPAGLSQFAYKFID